MKKLTLAQFKKTCGLTKADIQHWDYTTRINSIRENADLCLEQGFITEATRKAAYRYADSQPLTF